MTNKKGAVKSNKDDSDTKPKQVSNKVPGKAEKANTIKRGAFEQDVNNVTVTLLAGKKLAKNDIDVVFTPEECCVTLTDGRRWKCKFFREIDYIQSKTQIKQMKIILRVKKKVPGHWMDLEYIAGQSEAGEAIHHRPTVISSPAHTGKKSEHDKKTQANASVSEETNKREQSNVSNSKAKVSTAKAKDDIGLPLSSKLSDASFSTDSRKNKLRPGSLLTKSANTTDDIQDRIHTKGARKMASLRRNSTGDEFYSETADDRLDLSDLLDNDVEKDPVDKENKSNKDTEANDADESVSIEDESESKTKDDGLYALNHVKNDFYEKSVGCANDTIILSVMVKNMIKESVELSVDGKAVGLRFKTTDSKFVAMNKGADENTTFVWRITVVDDLIPSQCSVKVLNMKADITLRKKEPRRWSALEAVNSREYAQTSSLWKPVKSTAAVQPTVQTQSNESSARVRETLTSQSKVGFVERSPGSKLGTRKVPIEHTAVDNDTKSSSKDSFKAPGKGYVLGDGSKDSSQKPTCMVSPLKPSQDKMVVPPGYTGLDNLGNTCFMNSILQVLANTTELRDYFLDGRFQREINHDNVLGSGGKLAVEFGTLLKVLWSGKRSSYAPSNLKKLVAQKKSMFSGFAQHDAQEYMSFLLDGLHEDVNRVMRKPYIEQVDSNGRPDEVVAEEFWRNHRLRNDSFLVDLFQGQYKSTLVCPECEKVSVTFDPFMHLPVPLPKKKRLLPVVFLWRDPGKRPIKFMLRLAKDATVENLKDAVHEKTKVLPNNLRVFEAHKSHIHMVFKPGASMTNVSACDKIFVQEVLSQKLVGEPVKEVFLIQRLLRPTDVPSHCNQCRKDVSPNGKLKRCTGCFRAGYCNNTCQKSDWSQHRLTCRRRCELLGFPFIVSLPMSQFTFSNVYQMADQFARYSVNIFQPPQSEHVRTPTSPHCGVGNPLATETTRVFSTSTMFGEDEHGDENDPQNVPHRDESCPSTSQSDTHEMNQTTETAVTEGTTDSPMSSIDTTNDQSDEKYDTVESNDNAADSTKPPTRLVIGKQQDPEGPAHMFRIKPCSSRDGQELPGGGAECLGDQGDLPLELGDVKFLAMDWSNDAHCRPYVLAQNKEWDVDLDSSMTQGFREEPDASLQQCISLFMEPEVLGSEEAWYCPSCKEHREATKQLSLWRLPNYLIIQLKRFSYRNFLWCDKVDKMVQFPTRGLDMSSYFTGLSIGDQSAPIYDLTGVVNHYGGIMGGHYTAYVRTPKDTDPTRNELDWRLCDDSRVTQVSEERVVTQAAYVLFYRRRGSLPVTSLPQHIDTATQDKTASVTKTASKLSNLADSQLGERQEEKSCLLMDSLKSSGNDSGISMSSQAGSVSDSNVDAGRSNAHSNVNETQSISSASVSRASDDASRDETHTMEADDEGGASYTDMDSVD